MADNVVANSGDGLGPTFLTAEGSFSGDTAKLPGVFQIVASGSEGSWTFTLVPGGAGAATAGSPRIIHASDDPGVVALQIIDDWDESDRAKVNLIAGQAGITGGAGAVGASTPRVTLASDDPAVVALQIIDDWDESDRCKTNTRLQAHTSGGATPVQFLDVDETEDEVKGSAGQVFGFIATNRRTSPLFLKFYDGTAAGITVGSDTPKMTIEIPANATDHTAMVCNFPVGAEFTTGITIAATTGFAVADTGAPGANELIVNVLYK